MGVGVGGRLKTERIYVYMQESESVSLSVMFDCLPPHGL